MKNTSSFANILNAVNKMKEGQGYQKDANEDNMWRCETDKAKNGFAIIRFLPGKTDEDVPFVKAYSHGFKSDTGKWFIEECPTTLGDQCPVCEANGVLWNSGIEANKEIVRERKRKLAYYANILVVSDPKNPDNEGKVKIFKFGAKIFDKILDKLQPVVMEGEDPIEPVNVFDPLEGANFKLKIRQVEGFANYDKSEFEDCTEIGNKKQITAIMEQLHDLNAFVQPDRFKSYDQLSTKLAMVLGSPAPVPATPKEETVQSKPAAQKPSKPSKPAAESNDGEGDDDDMAYFRRLAEEND